MERKTLVRALVLLNATLLCVLVWLLVSDKKAANKPVKLDGLELADSLDLMEIQKDSLESSDSSCVYEPGKGAEENAPGSHSGTLR